MLSGVYRLTVHSNHRVVSGFGFEHHRTIHFIVSPTLIIEIDIKPGSDDNPINLKSNGVIPVAILGSDHLDMGQVDVSTVMFGPGEAAPIHADGHLEDINGDTIMDLVLHFKTQETGINNSDEEASLTGKMVYGQDIAGTDSISIVAGSDKGKGKAKMPVNGQQPTSWGVIKDAVK